MNKNGKTKKIAGVEFLSILVFFINFSSNFSLLFNQLILIIFFQVATFCLLIFKLLSGFKASLCLKALNNDSDIKVRTT
jgi:hypothetical protein